MKVSVSCSRSALYVGNVWFLDLVPWVSLVVLKENVSPVRECIDAMVFSSV